MSIFVYLAMAYFGRMIAKATYRTSSHILDSTEEITFVNTTVVSEYQENNTVTTLVDTQTWTTTVEVLETMEYIDREFDTTNHTPGLYGFAVGATPYYGVDYNAYSPSTYQVSRTGYGSESWSWKNWNWCNSTTFGYNWTAAYNKYVNWYYCLASKTWYLQGTSTSADYQYISFDLER